MKTVTTGLLMLTIILTAGGFSSADEPEPIEPWSPCNIENELYNYATSTAAPWQLNNLCAVPEDVADPESWDQSSAFQQHLLMNLDQAGNAQAYAEACGSTWQTFISGMAQVYVTLKRTITRTDTPLECITGSWLPLSTATSVEQTDVSEWLKVGDIFQVSDEATVNALQQDLETLLSQINGQPGSQANQ